MGNFKTESLGIFLILGLISLAPVDAKPATLEFECPKNGNGFYPSPTSCDDYYHCTDGVLRHAQCPSGFYFNPSNNQCDFPENVICSIGVQSDPISLKGSEIIGPAPDFVCPSNGAHPHETDCLLFYDCWEEVAVLFTCTERMLYDTRYRGCNYAAQVDCGDRFRPTNMPSTVTPPSNSTTRPPPVGDFECPEAGGAFPHSLYCEYYWTCWDWEPRLDVCQGDYLFDTVYSGCNFPDQVDCGERQRPNGTTDGPGSSTVRPSTTDVPTGSTSPPDNSTTTVRSTTGGGGDFVCPAAEGNFADPLDCAGFYSCLNFEIIGHQYCPDPLYFNERINNCDFPWNVDCPWDLKK